MQANQSQKNLRALEAWADQLACPACLSALRFGPDQIVCTGCGRIYPVIDGIPVLIVERAISGSGTPR